MKRVTNSTLTAAAAQVAVRTDVFKPEHPDPATTGKDQPARD